MRNFLRKQFEKTGLNDRVFNSETEDEQSNDDEQSSSDGGQSSSTRKRGRRLHRSSDKLRRGRDSSTSSVNKSSPAGQHLRSVFRQKFRRSFRKLAKEADAKPGKIKAFDQTDDSLSRREAANNSNFTQTETPINSANTASSDQEGSNFSTTTAQSRAGSDWQSGSTATDQSDNEQQKQRQQVRVKNDEVRLLQKRPDDIAAYNPQAKSHFTVCVRIIEAKELQGDNLHPLVRIHLGDKTRTTRSIRGTLNPRWDQTLSFSMHSSVEDLATLNCEFNVYSARRLIRDSLIGSSSINTGMVYKSAKQSVVEKWLALMPGQEEESGPNSSSEIRGFLRISMSVYHINQIPPSLISRGNQEDGEDVLYSIQLLNYCLRFRIFKLCQLADHIRYPYRKTFTPAELALEICVGPYRAMTSFVSANDETLYLCEEIQVPIMWPTIVKQIRFRLIAVNGRKRKRVLCTEFLSLQQLCQPGEQGFLPNFGPSFLSFYGPESKNTLWKRWERNQIREGRQQGTHYCGRVYFEILCEESTIQRTHVTDIPTSMIQASEAFHRQEHFTLFCSFFCANLIHSDFKSKNVQFTVSIGEFGNMDYDKVLTCTNHTLPVMPAFDTTFAYTMPWGNQKPVCEILCEWEDIAWRLETTNVLLKIANLMTQCQEETAMKWSSNPEQSELASVVVEALEEATECFTTFYAIVKEHSSNAITSLDILLSKARLSMLASFYKDFVDLKFEKFNLSNINEYAIRQLGVFARQLTEMANDPQLSIPDIVIHMIVEGNVVGYARIPAAEVYFGQSPIRCGKYCGRIRAVPLSWPTAQISKFRGHELPCFIHIKAWFGKSRARNHWFEQVKPAVIKHYAELFYNERRKNFSSTWEETGKKPYTISDESGQIKLSECAIKPPAGWEFKSNWTAKRSHDMWVGADAGHTTFEDEFFEVQQKNPMTQEWMKYKCTDYYGEPVEQRVLNKPPLGWQYDSKWAIDLHCVGDADGWQYSITDNFWYEDRSTVDSVERQTHKFRRRRYKRRRHFAKNDASVAEMFEDIRAFAKNLDEEGWEYAQRWGEPVHLLQQSGDHFRRRRMVRELVPVGESKIYKLEMGIYPTQTVETDSTVIELQTLSPRIYEVHDQVSVFQLRVYLLWACELYSPKKHICRAYVRVFFLNRCQQTCVVENTMNPIWNETLVFNRLLVPGGILALQNNSPSAVVECHGEEVNGKHVFLGRFDAHPSVISSPTDSRTKPVWYPLRFPNNKIKGAILMHMELFQADPTTKSIVPIMPIAKRRCTDVLRYEVPPDVRPEFGTFTVQIMTWGVRNLARFQLLSVRSPFIEITVADRREITDTIQDTAINPNFVRPLLTFAGISMPTELSYAPPIVLNLHDRRSFGRQPLIGVCVVKNFQRYMRTPPSKQDIKRVDADWDAFDAKLLVETKMQNSETKEMQLYEPEEYSAFPDDPNSPKIDWWSKYYYSKGMKDKAPGYKELRFDPLQVYNCPLETVGEYNGFADFLDTFVFLRPTNSSLDGDPNAEKRGELKGKLFITCQDNKKVTSFAPSGVEFDKPVECLVRIYVVRAFDLISRRHSGQCDPYITLRCGSKKKFKGQKDYLPDTLNPVFGQCVEVELTIPQEKDLTITVMDKRLLLSDNEIGSTTIDLENRLLTKFRATVGLPAQYNVVGPLPWRDQLNPLQTLRRYCIKMNLPPPCFLHSTGTDVGIELVGVEFWLSELESEALPNKHFAGRPLQRLALHILRKIGLVPEHVESRPLYNSVNPDMPCGTLELFVDIFPKSIVDKIPPMIDISSRQPKPFQLRVVIFQLRNVILQKKLMGRPAADLYVRCYLNGMEKPERTDIHYRCLDGAASFNWRFVFDFDYDVFERQIQAHKKRRLFRKRSNELVDPSLVIEIWDNNKFKRDKYIGQCSMNLLKFEEGQIDEDEMENVGYDKEPLLHVCCAACTGTACYCWRTRCCMKKQRKRDLVRMPRAPRYMPGNVAHLSLFQQRFASGWWPCVSSSLPRKQRGKHKKNDQSEEDDAHPNTKVAYVTGMVEMELQLMPLEEANAEPVGKGRNKPNHSPFLSKPDRPRLDSLWCTSRLKVFSQICWNKFGGWSCLWLTLLVLFLVLFSLVWHLPEILTQKLL